MNRKQRRQMSKNLGIMEFQRKLPFAKKMELIRENILAGKQREEEFRLEVEQSLAKQDAEKEDQVIAGIAEAKVRTKGISLTKATTEAQKEYKKTHLR